MLHRLADGLRRFFKFLSRKNRPTHKPFAQVADGLDGIEKISEGDKCEPKGSQKSYKYFEPFLGKGETEIIFYSVEDQNTVSDEPDAQNNFIRKGFPRKSNEIDMSKLKLLDFH